jgi:Protein of unknown function (DUF2867)
MRPEICAVPKGSAIGQEVVDAAFFCDAYRAVLTKPKASVLDIYFSVFGHHPAWMKWALIMRNRLAAAAGLATAADVDILHPRRRLHYQVGDLIGPWPIFGLTETELIVGRDNRHLDFRLSVLIEPANGWQTAVISTVCTTHNLFGQFYLSIVTPFHTWGMKLLISRAFASGRL